MAGSLRVGEFRGVVLRCRQARRSQGHEGQAHLWLRKEHLWPLRKAHP